MSKTQIGRLDSIQGMRGIAVILVLLFHFNNNLFYIGHVGVDIFFVISGYLITSLILKEINTSGKFNFGNL